MTEKIATLDTTILIHAFRQILPTLKYQDVDQEMSGRAGSLIQTLNGLRVRILVPAIVVAEYLSGPDPEHQETTLNAFRDQIEIPPFDLRAASIAAGLWRAHRASPPAEQVVRTVLKADVLIIATAKAFGATDYYSNDRGSRRLAEQAGLDAHDLPELNP